jgi:hypothetical protein
VAADGIPRELIPTQDDPWLIQSVRDSGAMRTAAMSSDATIPSRPWPELVQTVASLPLISERDASRVNGVLTVGTNSRLKLDTPYLDFLRLVAAQVSGSISALRSIENEARAARVKEILIRASASHTQLARNRRISLRPHREIQRLAAGFQDRVQPQTPGSGPHPGNPIAR